MEYPIVETFFSIQGEGFHVGRLVNFIRLAGCPINCEFCDTDKVSKGVQTEFQLGQKMQKGFPVVITGGEPCIHDLNPLTQELRAKGFLTYLETSGVFPVSGVFSYVSVSPKKTHHFTKQFAGLANEVKWLVPTWTLEEIGTLSEFFKGAKHYIQPVNDFLGINARNVRTAILVATNLNYPISVQLHKLLKVR